MKFFSVKFKPAILIYAAPMQLVWLIYLLALWPGLMSPDSVGQWNQALSGQINDAHPAFHTMFLAVLARIRPNPALVALVQILVLSFVAGYILCEFESRGIPRRLLITAALIFAFSPVNSLMVNAIWKDILYSIAFLGLSGILLKMIVTHGAWLKKGWRIGLLAVTAFSVAIFRHNGVFDSFGTLILLIFGFRSQTKRLLLALALTLSLWLGIRGPFYDIMKVKKVPGLFLSSQELFQIAAHLKAGTEITEPEAAFLNKILPIENAWNYDCYTSGVFFYDPRLNRQFVSDHLSELNQIFLALTLRAPEVNLKHLACSSSLVWKVFDNSQRFSTIPTYFDHGKWRTIFYPPTETNVSFSPKIPWLTQPLMEFVDATHYPRFIWFIWRPALYLYLSFMIVIMAALRCRDWRFLFLLAPIMIHSAFLVISLSSQDFRYQYPVYLFALLFWPLLFYRRTVTQAQPKP
jgi:hypothetical protein